VKPYLLRLHSPHRQPYLKQVATKLAPAVVVKSLSIAMGKMAKSIFKPSKEQGVKRSLSAEKVKSNKQ
jgi:hypothetical protein